jgi:uncharacterized protein HemX
VWKAAPRARAQKRLSRSSGSSSLSTFIITPPARKAVSTAIATSGISVSQPHHPAQDDRRSQHPAALAKVSVLVVLPEAVVVYYKVQRHRHKEQQEVFETRGQPVEEQIADEGGVDGFTH